MLKSDIEIARKANTISIQKVGSKLGLQEEHLLPYGNDKAKISEKFIKSVQKNKNGKLILVTAINPTPAGEGKTTTVANLAITYANMGKKTLLVDADLRKPVLHKMFKNRTNKGLTNYLSNTDENLNEIMYDSGVENLKIITSGIVPPNPSELLASSNMNQFVNKIKNEFDVVLFDTPPLIAVTDAFVITKHVDKFLLVVRASVTQKGALERSLVNMNNMDHKIDGVIFNGVDESSTYGGGYYYNYYQYYYGNDEK